MPNYYTKDWEPPEIIDWEDAANRSNNRQFVVGPGFGFPGVGVGVGFPVAVPFFGYPPQGFYPTFGCSPSYGWGWGGGCRPRRFGWGWGGGCRPRRFGWGWGCRPRYWW